MPDIKCAKCGMPNAPLAEKCCACGADLTQQIDLRIDGERIRAFSEHIIHEASDKVDANDLNFDEVILSVYRALHLLETIKSVQASGGFPDDEEDDEGGEEESDTSNAL